MSLHKKLQLWLSTTFLVIIASVFGLVLHYSHLYLASQQKIELTNTISALNIALTPYIDKKDKVGIESVINAAFDSGFYGSISLTMYDNTLQINKQDAIETSPAPAWFRALAPFETLSESRILQNGWLQVAELKVTSNSHSAYTQLWAMSTRLFTAFVILLLIAAASLHFVLNLLLAPLKSIQKRANEISLNQFGDPIPSVNTRELSDVVEAINCMAKHVEAYYVQSVNELKQLHMRAFRDPVSNLYNRNFFVTQLEPWINNQNGNHCGLCLLQVDVIEAAYQNKEFQKADEMANTIARQLEKLIDAKDTLARFSLSEFIILIPHSRIDNMHHVSQQALSVVNEVFEQVSEIEYGAVGMLVVSNQPDITTVFTQLDNALSQARQSNEKIFLFNQEAILPQYIKGRMEWQNLVKHAIESDLIKLELQPAINQDNQVIHYEVFPYFEVNHVVYTVNRFITALNDSDIATLFDIHVLKLVKEHIRQNPAQTPLAVNITRYSVRNEQFNNYLEQVTITHKKLNQLVLLELQEVSFIKNIDDVSKVIHVIERCGFRYGIDNFGHSFHSVDFLHQLQPAYIKLDFAYTSQLNHPQKQGFVSSITRAANNFNIATIATHVDSLSQLEALSKLEVTGFQGKITHKWV
ncbi:bifunctional diguanylate cyclase/phosphodiesterase [Vibrio gangliei]|uniref:bifunctional diguanylate cyclase/phosphodiesterase n=1 Tax=Vibrio gangliei TaxID=2077090 RepID=UPI0014742060|nr:EAL domain-containing protein [Vibrio gangliei]